MLSCIGVSLLTHFGEQWGSIILSSHTETEQMLACLTALCCHSLGSADFALLTGDVAFIYCLKATKQEEVNMLLVSLQFVCIGTSP